MRLDIGLKMETLTENFMLSIFPFNSLDIFVCIFQIEDLSLRCNAYIIQKYLVFSVA